jgi:hypothetical protein
LIFVLKTFQKSFSSHTYQKVSTRNNTETQRLRDTEITFYLILYLFYPNLSNV